MKAELDFDITEEYISKEEIHKIRKGISSIDDSELNKEHLRFIDYSLDFRAIKMYFDDLSKYQNSQGSYSFRSAVYIFNE